MSRTNPAPHHARALLRLLALLVLGLMSSGCFGGQSSERSYFTLQYPMGEQVRRYAAARYPVLIRVQRFDTANAYNRNEMVYRQNPHQFQYYYYKLWAAKPDKMMRELVIGHLRQSNLAEGVVEDIVDRLPDYELRAEVLAIEELNASNQEWYAHLSMRFSLIRFKDNTRLWEYTFDEREPVFTRQPVYVVQTLSEILEAQMHKIVAELDVVLAQETGIELDPDAVLRPSVAALNAGEDTDAAPDAGTGSGSGSGAPTPDDGLDPNEPGARLKEN